MVKKSPVCLIILNHNNEDVIKDLYKSLIENNDYPAYLIFIDNGSVEDKSLQFLYSICRDNPYNFLIKLPINYGTTRGWNVGLRFLRKSNPRYVGFINSDMTVGKKWLSSMIEVLENNPNAGAVSNQLRDPRKRSFIQNDGPDIKNPFHYVMRWDRRRLNPRAFPCEWIHMGCTIFKYEVFKEIGLFDENFFIYSSDFDIQIRTKLAGYELWHCRDSIAYHRTFWTCEKLRKNDDYERLMRLDGKKFNEKWGDSVLEWFRKTVRPTVNLKELEELHKTKIPSIRSIEELDII